MVKRFDSAPRATDRPQEETLAPLPFGLPGSDRIFIATPPKRAVWQRAMLAGRPNVPQDRQAAAIVDFMRGCLADVSDGQHLEDRLLSPHDKLDVSDLFAPAAWLSTSWGEQAKNPAVRKAAWAEYEEHLALEAAGEPTPEVEQPDIATPVGVDELIAAAEGEPVPGTDASLQ